MFPFSCNCWYINLILFVLLYFECSFVASHRILHLLFNNEPNIVCGEQTINQTYHHKMKDQKYSPNNTTSTSVNYLIFLEQMYFTHTSCKRIKDKTSSRLHSSTSPRCRVWLMNFVKLYRIFDCRRCDWAFNQIIQKIFAKAIFA